MPGLPRPGRAVRSRRQPLVPDQDKTIAEGAVLPWNSGGRRLSMYAAGELGLRLDVPSPSLTDHERDIVLHGEPVQRRVTLHSGRNGRSVQLSVNYDNAVAAVERSLRSDNERTRRGTVIAQGTPGQLETDPRSIMGRFLAGAAAVRGDRPTRPGPGGHITIEIGDLYNLHDLAASFPVGRLTALAGPSGAGKTALILDSPDGGRILAAGTPADIARAPGCATGPWLAGHLGLPETHQRDVLSHR